MATLKFDYTGQCAGGGHSFLNVLVNGAVRGVLALNTATVINPPAITPDDAQAFATTLLMFDRRKWLRDNPTGTNAQYIAHLEAEEWVF